jgi:hypothetical protein
MQKLSGISETFVRKLQAVLHTANDGDKGVRFLSRRLRTACSERHSWESDTKNLGGGFFGGVAGEEAFDEVGIGVSGAEFGISKNFTV